jgi:hypothetical protein
LINLVFSLYVLNKAGMIPGRLSIWKRLPPRVDNHVGQPLNASRNPSVKIMRSRFREGTPVHG